MIGRWSVELDSIMNAVDHSRPKTTVEAIFELGKKFDEQTAAKLLSDFPALRRHVPTATRLYHDYVVSNEQLDAARMLSRAADGFPADDNTASPFSQAAYDRVNAIFDHIDFARCQKFVMVGCGQMPYTALQVHAQTEVAAVLGIDISPTAIESVRSLAERLSLRRLGAELVSGADYDFHGADAIYVANMVSPKNPVMSRIADTAPENVQVVMREPYSLGILWNECGEDTLDPRLEVCLRGPGSVYLARDVVLRRRGN